MSHFPSMLHVYERVVLAWRTSARRMRMGLRWTLCRVDCAVVSVSWTWSLCQRSILSLLSYRLIMAAPFQMPTDPIAAAAIEVRLLVRCGPDDAVLHGLRGRVECRLQALPDHPEGQVRPRTLTTHLTAQFHLLLLLLRAIMLGHPHPLPARVQAHLARVSLPDQDPLCATRRCVRADLADLWVRYVSLAVFHVRHRRVRCPSPAALTIAAIASTGTTRPAP